MFSQRNKTMCSVRFVLLLILVGTIQMVCADDDIQITCADVTGKVGETLNLTCSVSYNCSGCNMTLYKFNNGTEFCRNVPNDPCEQWTIITCPYTLNVTMTTTFKFSLQTNCGYKSAEFTVNVSDTKDPTKAPPITAQPRVLHGPDTKDPTEAPHISGQTSYITAGITCLTLLLLLLIIIIIFIEIKSKKMREKCANPFRSCMDYEMGDNDDNSISSKEQFNSIVNINSNVKAVNHTVN